MKQVQALFFFLIALINLVKAQEPIASAHCNFDEGFYPFNFKLYPINFELRIKNQQKSEFVFLNLIL